MMQRDRLFLLAEMHEALAPPPPEVARRPGIPQRGRERLTVRDREHAIYRARVALHKARRDR